MSKVIADMSMSLDGYIAGPNDSINNPLGDDGEHLHEWMTALESWGSRMVSKAGSATRTA